jgi:amino acid transporter
MPHAIALPPLTHLTLPFCFAFFFTPELATTFPENSGYVAWVTAAFGPFWGFQVGAGWVA